LAQGLELLQRKKRLSYRVLKRRFGVDDDELEDLKEDLIYAKKLAVDEAGRVLVWTGDATTEPPTVSPGRTPDHALRRGALLRYLRQLNNQAGRLGPLTDLAAQIARFGRLGFLNAVQMALDGVCERFPAL
jgi:hypothetical protein